MIEAGKSSSKTDLWSLGVMAYEMACFRQPFEGDSIAQLYDSISGKDYKSLPATYSINLSKFVDNLLRKNPKNRPTLGRKMSRQTICFTTTRSSSRQELTSWALKTISG